MHPDLLVIRVRLIKIVNPRHDNPKRLSKIINRMPNEFPAYLRNIYNEGRLYSSVEQAKNWCEIITANTMRKHANTGNPTDIRTYVSMCLENFLTV